jgi:hypothetical protein
VDKETRGTAAGKSEAPSFEELAVRQGVHPVTNFNALLGRPSGEDESVEEFSAMLREWRRESASTLRGR